MNRRDDQVSLNIFDLIDSICRQFRNEWKTGKQPDIESHYTKVPEPAQPNLFHNLLETEVQFRRRRGENPNSDDYLNRFPKFSRQIRRVFDESTMMSMDPLQDTPVVDSAHFADPLNQDASFDSLAHQQAAYAPMEMPAARRIGDYELIRELGRGGMGVVYEAKHLQRQNHVALKTLPTGVDGQEVNAERLHKFRNEFRSLSEINHPNLVGMQSLEVEGNQWFFTMDLINGVDFLSHVRPHGQLDSERLRLTLKPLATGIIFLHKCGIVHRDLKPSNVLVDETGRVVLLDFGLVAELQQATDKSASLSTAHFVGTPRYAAPEQMFGERTQATDWYAFGTMLYEALTGNPPFTGKPMEILKQKQSEDPPGVSDMEQTGLDSDLLNLTDRLLKRDPKQRPATNEIIETLQLDLQTRNLGPTVGADSSSGSIDDKQLAWQDPYEDVVLIGREKQLAQLESAKQEFLEKRKPMVVWITGKSGEGKSVLAEKFLQPIRQGDEILVLSGRCYDRESVPFKAVDCIIDPLVRFLNSGHGHRYRTDLPADIAFLARLFPTLNRVKEIGQSKIPEYANTEPEKVRARGLYALRELLASIASHTPVVLLIDDLQWGDADSARPLVELFEALNDSSILLIGSYRSDEADDSPFLKSWIRFAEQDSLELPQQVVQVHSLSQEQCIELAALRTGVNRNTLSQQAEVLFADSGGNPYFVEQLTAGFDLVTGQFQHIPLDQIIDRRLEKLPPTAAKLLEVIAISGQPILVDEACRAIGLTSAEMGTFNHMRNERLVRWVGDKDAMLVETYHDKIRETVLEALTELNRQRLHLALAETIEAKENRSANSWLDHLKSESTPGEFDQPLSHRVVDLAHHYLSADDPRAFVYQMLAGEQALMAFAFEDALGFYEEAEQLLAEDSHVLRFRLYVALGRVCIVNNRNDQSIKAYQAALEAAPDNYHRALTNTGLADVYRILSMIDESIRVATEALSLLGKRLPNSLLGKVSRSAWNAIRVVGIPVGFHRFRSREMRRWAELEFRILDGMMLNYAEKKTVLDSLVATSSATIAGLQCGKAASISDAFGYFAFLLSALGRFRMAKHFFRKAAKYDFDDKTDLYARNLERRAFATYWAGDLPESRKDYRQVLPLLLKFGEIAESIRASHHLRHITSYIGNSSSELEYARETLVLSKFYRNPQGICWGYYDVAVSLARKGELEEAILNMSASNGLLHDERFLFTETIRASSEGYVRLQCSDYSGALNCSTVAWQLIGKYWNVVDANAYCLPILVESLAGPNWKSGILPDEQKLLRKMLRRATFFYSRVPNHQPHLQRVIGRAAMTIGKKNKAIKKFQKAIALAKKKGMDYQRAKSLLDLAAVTEEHRKENRAKAIQLLKEMESVIPRAESWLLGDQYDEEVVAPEFDLEAWEKLRDCAIAGSQL